jgi:hypothetical protein
MADTTYNTYGVVNVGELPKIIGTESFHITASCDTNWYYFV